MTYNPSYRRILHKMGYYNYQQGLIYRHLNQEGGWKSHLQNCRRFILKALEIHKPVRVTVLGSGWLLDLPLKEITEVCENVCLIDIVHPPEVIDQVRSLKQVELVEDDITGGLIEEEWIKARNRLFFNKLRSLDDIIVPEYQLRNDPGLVISLNVFTQLESLPLEFLKKRSKVEEDSYYYFRKAVQEKHIDFLKKHQSVLITDLSEVITDSSGKITEVISVLDDLPEGNYREEWTWHFDTKRSDYYKKRSVFKVLALIM